jgi:hypothetical protein
MAVRMIELYLVLEPVSLLVVGKVWSIDVGRRGIYGVGWRIRRRRVRA